MNRTVVTVLAVIASAAALVAAPVCAKDKQQGQRDERKLPAVHLVPDATGLAPPLQLTETGAFDITSNGLRLRVEPLSEAERETYFRLRTSEGMNVLPSVEGVDPFTVFSLSIENGTGNDVTFLASMTELRDQNDASVSPIPADTLGSLFRAVFDHAKNPDQAAHEALACIHSQALILRHGERATRLLVFPPPPRGAKHVDLNVEELQVGQQVLAPTFPFVVAPGLAH